jgi:intracellular septation protein
MNGNGDRDKRGQPCVQRAETGGFGVERPMRDFLNAARLLFRDLASTILFLVVFLLTHNAILAVGFGVALSLAQIGTQFVRRKPIDMMEWLSLFLVIYTIVGVVMLKPGWLNRYLPDIAKAVVPDIAMFVGYLWAGLMFVSAAVNAFVALAFSVTTWALVMPIFGITSKVVVFLAGFAAMRLIGRRRVRAMPAPERDALLAATGRL